MVTKIPYETFRRITRREETNLPDGSLQLALGANRVARQQRVPRTGVYELRMRFTVPEQEILDLTRVELYEVTEG